ncbi:MAG: 6-carboxytetrahydropterin synthase [Nitrospirae bacterium]|nr:6-carboxytetrahydropterin synthase [Nitrospirota bacterium]
MAQVLLTKRIEFAAAHRYHNEAWDSARNRAVFGACNNDPGHGHNYMLEVTVSGEVDRHTGMVINLFDLKRVIQEVLEEFDHNHLNLDTPYFQDAIPTTENIARVLWQRLETQKDIGRLHAVRLYEDEDLFADVTASAGLDVASVTRRYQFTAVYEGDASSGGNWNGHTCDLFVAVRGPIDRETGMVTNIVALDRLVQEKVIQPFNGQDLRKVLGIQKVTGEHLARTIWGRLVISVPSGKLERVRLVQTRDLAFEYAR